MSVSIASQAEVISSSKSQQNISATSKPTYTNESISDVKTLTSSSVSEARHLKLQPRDSIFNPPSLISQTPEVESLRNYLKIKPLKTSTSPSEKVNSPGLTFATPSGFGANWGDVFFSTSAATPGKSRSGQVNGSLTTGFGLGDAQNAVGLELNFNIGSIKNFGSNGSVDGKLHRIIYSDPDNQVSIAAGWKGFIQYGSEGVSPSSVYGAVTYYSTLQPDNEINKMPISFTVGVGGGEFRKGDASIGVFADFGVQVAPQLSVGAGWSGVGINVGLSYVPFPSVPLTVALTGGDLTDISNGGRVVVLSIGYGFNWALRR